MAAILCLSSAASTVFGQNIRATITGLVADQSGAVVPNARVTTTNTGTNETRSVVTNSDGNYTIPQLQPGDYTLTTEAAGFKKVVQRITLQTGQEARLDLQLTTGAVTDLVEITAAAPVVSTEDGSLGNVVDQKKIVELPLNGRDYLQLAQLQPNVFQPAQGSTLGFRGGFNVAGSSEATNNFLKDGIDNSDETTGQPLHKPIVDAVREFKVLTGTYAAEYGRMSGGQIIVTTKSGANQFHGSAFEFHRNAIFDARNFFVADKPDFRRNQYGGVLGGPIRQDRTFFFAGYEGQRRGSQDAALATVPIAAFKQGDFSSIATALRNPFNNNQPFAGNLIPQSLWSRQGAGLLALFPNPNRTGNSNNLASTATGKTSADQFSVRLDHKFGEKDNFYGVYERADSDEFYPLANPQCGGRLVAGFGCSDVGRAHHIALNWTHIFSQRLVAEARVGYNRLAIFRLHEDRDRDVVNALGIGGLPDVGKTPFNNGSPEIRVTGYSLIGGPTNLTNGRHDNTYHYIGNLTWILDKHTLKGGADIRRFLYNSFFTSFGRGSFRFDGRYTGNAVADLLLGLPFQADRNLGEPFHNAKTFSSGYYLQDDWKPTSKLTLNLGLRYELNLPPIESVNKISSFDPDTSTIKVAGDREAFINPATGLLEIRSRPGIGRRLWETDTNNFAPRLGLAWRLFGDNKTVLRAGFGTFYNLQAVGNGITPLSRNSPFRQRQTAIYTAAQRPSLVNAFTGNPSVIAPGIDPKFRTAYTNQWSLGIQRELAQNLVLEVAYQGSEGHKLPQGVDINQALPPSAQCIATPTAAGCSLAARRPFRGFGSITGGYVQSIGNSNFHSLQTRVERRLSSGLSFLSSYTWSKSIDQTSGITTVSESSGGAQNARNLRAERGPSDFDVSHRWVLSYVYDLPFGGSGRFTPANRIAKALASGWQVNGIFTVQTGRPFTVITGVDNSSTGANGGTISDRPNLIGDPHLANPGPNRWFNPCTLLADGTTRRNCQTGDTPAWRINAPGTFGNAGRNLLRGPGLKNFDLGIARFFKITERHRLQFRAEVFNLANHPNFFLPIANAAGANFGTISRAVESGAGAQRQIQFALKYLF
jgi:hypothetical protein